ncbi:hypothetical protein [Pedobacter sp. SL55]|uniref:hypothetical protein n=1 Tax=Pedobacter sp. SL55 TaxID=2995161 RepID=UPI002270ADAD|nr:hypothetical protein [Pedobacter sp. SL55]WAC39659.1 hypothetical protein OVA16_13855 [Pedobacter sp. SL55]
MPNNSTDTNVSKLQQDAPVSALPQLSNSSVQSVTVSTNGKSSTELPKPFFLYPKDGLYGLL